MTWTWRSVEATLVTTPTRISAMPIPVENPDDLMWRSTREAESSRRKSPNLATTKPNPINARPVRIHARKVRSAARNTRGSVLKSCAMLFRAFAMFDEKRQHCLVERRRLFDVAQMAGAFDDREARAGNPRCHRARKRGRR